MLVANGRIRRFSLSRAPSVSGGWYKRQNFFLGLQIPGTRDRIDRVPTDMEGSDGVVQTDHKTLRFLARAAVKLVNKALSLNAQISRQTGADTRKTLSIICDYF